MIPNTFQLPQYFPSHAVPRRPPRVRQLLPTRQVCRSCCAPTPAPRHSTSTTRPMPTPTTPVCPITPSITRIPTTALPYRPHQCQKRGPCQSNTSVGASASALPPPPPTPPIPPIPPTLAPVSIPHIHRHLIHPLTVTIVIAKVIIVIIVTTPVAAPGVLLVIPRRPAVAGSIPARAMPFSATRPGPVAGGVRAGCAGGASVMGWVGRQVWLGLATARGCVPAHHPCQSGCQIPVLVSVGFGGRRRGGGVRVGGGGGAGVPCFGLRGGGGWAMVVVVTNEMNHVY